ncbi:HlyD family secretion protein [Patescibacteria group bacterium]|nr:HlyD family secretion protein [Patescibacteria group bacterium]
MKAQLLNNEQSLAILQNNLRGEVITAPFNGMVRSVNVQLSNKVQPGTLICQITPTDTASVKVQIFSSRHIELGTDVSLYDNEGNLISA